MGVQATAHFYNILHDLQSVDIEQDYADVLVYSKPSIPDRTTYILNVDKPSPVPHLLDAVQLLERAGVGCIAIPCVTSHVWHDELSRATCLPILHMPRAAADMVAGLTRVGLLATSGTLCMKLFHNAMQGTQIIEPSECEQAELMEYIYNIKKGYPADPERLAAFANALRGRGAQVVMLGCTELSVAADGKLDGYIDPLVALAHAALRATRESAA